MPDSRIKRRRLVFSCLECKRRKLKCDRQIPVCSRCIDMGHPELCKYDHRSFRGMDMQIPDSDHAAQFQSCYSFQHQLQATTLDNFDPTAPLAEDYQLSLPAPFQLPPEFECPHSSNVSLTAPPSAPCGDDVINPLGTQQQATRNRTKSLNGQFWGPSHPTSIMASFQGIHGFLRKTIQDHHILGALKWGSYTPSANPTLPSHSKDEVRHVMKRLLPPKQQCRRLLHSYFDHFTGIYGVFHVPTFWQEFDDYWNETHNEPVRFIAVLLSAVSCSKCFFMADPLSFDGDSSTARNEVIRWLHAVETWLSYRMVETTKIEAFQIRCLVLFSKILNDIERKDHYTVSQILLVDAISSGLHRDWKVLGIGESIFERELRRKIWSAVADLDIACCIERGVPSIAFNLFTNIEPPNNYNDCDYDETTESEPQVQPDSWLTDNSFTRFSHSIRPIRCRINKLVNNPIKHKSMSQTKFMALWQQISNSLSNMHDWSEPTSGVASHNRGVIYRMVLQLYLHELVHLLHLPFALGKNGGLPMDKDYHRFICIKSAAMIIKIYQDVPQHGFSQIALPRAGLLRSGLSLCLIEADVLSYDSFLLALGCHHNLHEAGLNSLPISPASRNVLVESALAMIEQRVLALGSDLQGLWLFSVASCYIESCRDATSSSACQKRITDHIITLFTKMCLTQEHKKLGFGSSDAHLARYIMQIQQTCDNVWPTMKMDSMG